MSNVRAVVLASLVVLDIAQEYVPIQFFFDVLTLLQLPEIVLVVDRSVA